MCIEYIHIYSICVSSQAKSAISKGTIRNR